METDSDADAPLPATPDAPTAEAPPEADAALPAGDEALGFAQELADLAAAADTGRLNTAQEERGTELLKQALQSGRAGVAVAVATLPRLPWLVGIRAVETVWPELTAGFRTQLLAGLAKDETDAARRMRLSLARALFRLEPTVGVKIAASVAREMHDKDSGGVATKDAQMFSNVCIGRARPWVAQLPLGELKPAEADALVQVAVLAAFSLPHPPVTQLAILKWAKENARLETLPENALTAVAAGVGRWNAKWQNVLRKEVADLPEAIGAALRPVEAEAPEAAERVEAEEGEAAPDESAAEESAEPAPRRERPVYISREEEARRRAILESGGTLEAEEPPEVEEEKEEAEEEEDTPRPPREARDYREPREPRGAGRHGSFNVAQALRQIEAHVNGLRSDLETAKAKLRNRDQEAQRAKRRPDAPVIEGEPTPEELARLNRQLELRNQELQARIDELTQHSEDLATASGALSDQPVADPEAQLRTLLALKLQEDYADFLALENEVNDVVVQQHYRTLIRHLFEVLLGQGIPLKAEAGES